MSTKVETWTVDIIHDPEEIANKLIWPNGNYKASRLIVDGLKSLAETGRVVYLDDDNDPFVSTVTISDQKATVEHERPDDRSLDYGSRHLAEIVTKLMSGQITPDITERVVVNSCMRRR